MEGAGVRTVELGLDGVEPLGEADRVVELRVGRVPGIHGRSGLELVYVVSADTSKERSAPHLSPCPISPSDCEVRPTVTHSPYRRMAGCRHPRTDIAFLASHVAILREKVRHVQSFKTSSTNCFSPSLGCFSVNPNVDRSPLLYVPDILRMCCFCRDCVGWESLDR